MSSAARMASGGKANPNLALALAVALLVIGLSGWIGMRARTATHNLVTSRGTWETTAAQLATVQQQFRVPSTTEASALVAEASRMSALGVPSDEKLSLVDMLGH